MFSAAGISTLKKTVDTFAANTTWTAPATTVRLDSASGYGARGANATFTTVQQYYFQSYQHTVHPDGSISDSPISTSGNIAGAKPADYCEPSSTDTNTGNVSSICYHFFDSSFQQQSNPATTGASTTGFGKTFPGALGNVAPAVTSFQNVAVTPGTGYPIVVPTGGSLTITYYK